MVEVTWPDISPLAIEKELISPLEAAFASIEGVTKIYSKTSVGSGKIELTASTHIDLDFFRFEVASKIRQIYKSFPNGVLYPQIYLQTPDKGINDSPVLVYSLAGPHQPATLANIANNLISQQLALISGLDKIIVTGNRDHEWRIQFDPDQIQELAISKEDLSTSIQRVLSEETLGKIKEGNRQFSLKVQEYADLETIPIKKLQDRTIMLGDIATVDLVPTKVRSHYRINGQNSIRLKVYADNQQNQLQFSQQIKSKIEVIKSQLPSGCKIFLDQDSTIYLSEELNKIKQRAGLSLIILLFFLLLIYRKWKFVLVIISSLIVNLCVAAILYAFLQVQLHIYALAAIAVSFSLIIDNSLVIAHHLIHHKNLNIFPALLASTLTTLAALAIIFFLPEKWRITLEEFARVMIINLFISLLIAAVFVPALLFRLGLDKQLAVPKPFLKRRFLNWHRLYEKSLQYLLKKKAICMLAIVLMFGTPFFLLPTTITDWSAYNRIMGTPFVSDQVRPFIDRILGGSLRPFILYVYDKAQYRNIGETQLNIEAQLPSGATLEQMNQVMIQLEALLAGFPTEIKQYITNVQSGEYGHIAVYFNRGYDQVFPHILKSKIINEASEKGGIEWSIVGIGEAFDNASINSPPRFRIAMYGYNNQLLDKYIKLFETRLLEHERILEVETDANIEWWLKDLFVLVLDVDHAKMAHNRLSYQQALNILSMADQNAWPDFFIKDIGVRLEAKGLDHRDKWMIQNKYYKQDSLTYSLNDFLSLRTVKRSNAIHKEDQQYIRLLEFEYTGAKRFGQEYLDACVKEMEKVFPPGFKLEQMDQYFFGEAKKYQYGLLLILVIGIFFITAITFESLTQSLTIISLIPISYIGIFLTFYLFNINFDQGGYASFILLSGIVVNSLIIIISEYNRYRLKSPHKNNLQNFIRAFHGKIIPILLTICSTVLGLIPFMLDGPNEPFWYTLAAGTIGGLLFSIITITFFIPIWFLKSPKQVK